MKTYGVVIPAWNAARTLREALDSVLAQTVPPARVVVVDDGSTDDTARIAEETGGPVELLRQANSGPGAATSAGLAALDLPVLATLDADDLWLPHKMERQMAAMAAGADLCFSAVRHFLHGVADDGTGVVRPGLIRSTMVVRRCVYETVGPLIDQPGRLGELVDWIARAREAGFGTTELDEVLALRRVMPGSLSWGRDPERDRGYLAVAHRVLMARRRKERGE